MIEDRTALPLSAADPGSCACCSTASDDPASEAPADGVHERSLQVTGMTCAHCVSSVTEELTEVDGVAAVSVDLVVGGSSTVTVTLSAPVEEGALRSAVEEAGYAVVAR